MPTLIFQSREAISAMLTLKEDLGMLYRERFIIIFGLPQGKQALESIKPN